MTDQSSFLGSLSKSIIGAANNAWKIAKTYLAPEPEPLWKKTMEEQRTDHHPNFKKLIMMSAMSLLANKDQLGLGMGLATMALFVEPVGAAYPTVANPIPTQYAQPGQVWNYDIDLNQVFNDTDGDIMTFGGATMADGSPLPSWLTAKPIKLSGRYYANEAYAVEVVGDLAYVANGQYGLLIFNVSNPRQKVFVGSIDTPGSAQGIAVQNEVAYVADYTSGIQIINVSDASKPMLLGSHDTPGTAYSIIVQESVAYVADDSSGLQIILVSNLSQPKLLGSYDTPGNAYQVIVQNQVAYVADYDFGLQLINVSNATNPTLLANYDTPGNARYVTVKNSIAYVADTTSGLQFIDVSNATNPTLLGSYFMREGASVIMVQNEIAFVSDLASGLQIIDISNVSNPIFLGRVSMPGLIYGITIQNEVAYIAGYGAGLQLINISNSSAPLLFGPPDVLEFIQTVCVQDNILYAGSLVFGFQLINVTNTSCLTMLSNYATGYIGSITVQNNVAYVAGNFYGFQLINITNPSQPSFLNSYNTQGECRKIVVENNIAYVLDNGLRFFNIINPDFAVELGSIGVSSYPDDMSIQNKIIYVTHSLGLQLVNVTDPSNPTTALLGRYPMADAIGVTVQNKVAYIADGPGGLQLVNVSNTSCLTFISNYDTPGYASRVTVQNGIAYVSDSTSIQFINITNATGLIFLGSYDIQGAYQAVNIENNLAYIANSATGLHIIDLGHTQLRGIVPIDVAETYFIKIHATNRYSEWISTNLELKIGVTSSSKMDISTSEFSSLTVLSSQTSTPHVILNIVTSSTPILIEFGINTLITSEFLFFSGNANPDQVIYTVPTTQTEYIFTVNGVDVTQFTQADVNSGFVAVTSSVMSCQVSSTDVQLQASVAGGTTQVDVNLIFQLTSTSCNNAGRSVDNTMMNAAALLITTSLGFWTKSRGKRENAKPTQEDECTTTFQLRH